MNYPIRIRLYPEETSVLYALVRIWPSRKVMREQHNKRYLEKTLKVGGSVLASCTGITYDTYEKGKKTGTLPIFAELDFSITTLDSFILSHELCHTALRYLYRRGLVSRLPIDPSSKKIYHDLEEAFCELQSNMFNQLTQRLAKLKIGPYEPIYD